MSKVNKLYLVSIISLVISIVFIATLVFINIREIDNSYVLVTRIFQSGISALFFYLAYALSAISLGLSIFAFLKKNYILKRISIFIKAYFLIILVSPFFTSIYSFFSHESGFFVRDLLAIYFMVMSLVLEIFATRIVEENTPREELISKYKLIINFDYLLLLITSIGIVIACFVTRDFYIFYNDYLSIIPIYFIPVLSLILYVINNFRLAYISSRYFTVLDIIKSPFAYYFIGYLSIVRLGFFAFSNYSLYEGFNAFRLILFLVFISIVIFNSIYKKIDLSFILGAIIITLFSFEIVGLTKLIQNNESFIYIMVSYFLDYMILIFLALPYYIYIGIDFIIKTIKESKPQ